MQLIQQEVKHKHTMADQGYEYGILEEEDERPVSTSISDNIKRLFIGCVVAWCCIVSVMCMVFHYQK